MSRPRTYRVAFVRGAGEWEFSPKSASQAREKSMGQERHILHADFDGFHIAVERAINPRLRGRPVVIGSHAGIRGVVAAVSAEARQYGVYPSMTTGRALTLCPSLNIVNGNGELYRRAAEAIGELLERFSPCVELPSRDEAFLDLTGTQKLFGAAVDAAARLRREVRARFSLELTIGVAANKLVARIASRTVRPAGVCDVTPGSETAFLAPLAVRCLPGVGPQTEKRLSEFNIITIGDLTESPRPLLASAFGKRGEVLYAQARGIDETPVRPARQPTTIIHEDTLTRDTNDRDVLAGMLFALVERCGFDLRAQRLLAGLVSISVEFISGQPSAAHAPLARPSDLDDELSVAAAEALARVLATRLAVRRIAVRLSRCSPATGQLALLDDGRRYDRRRALAEAIDHVREAYGPTAVTAGRIFARAHTPAA